jgi:NtrC-family two-component system sensor histidine kinase KinB
MKLSIRTKFALGMVFMFVIILVLMGFSAFYLNKLSNKTSAILKENYLSVVYAREMTEGLVNINQEITTEFISGNTPDDQLINKELKAIDHSFQLEKNNITEPGEDKLVSDIEKGIREYRDSVKSYFGSPQQATKVLYLQKKMGLLSQQLVLLSQINGKAIEAKTDDAKASSVSALTQMTILGTFCFLIALSFIYSFASYFNERFFQLYNGIKEIVSSNYGQRLYFDGVDEFYEISLLFNQMAEKLSGDQSQEDEQIDFLTISEISEQEQNNDNLNELKNVLVRLKSIEKQAEEVISKIENKE